MPVFLTSGQKLPQPKSSMDDLVAVGGQLSTDSIWDAYQKGIFPWYSEGQPLLWWSPDPRMVLFPERLHIAKSMRPYLNQNKFQLTRNLCFEKVIHTCAEIPRRGQDGTWITPEMIEAYIELHRSQRAESFEVWNKGELVGGLYGVYLKGKGIFCGESMFSHQSNASKFGFIKAVRTLQNEGVQLIDCQVYNPHLEKLGATEVSRGEFLNFINP